MRPLRTSIIVACGYIAVCCIYIWLSGVAAVKISQSIPALHSIELYKGLAFVIVTGILIFIIEYNLLLRIHDQNRELEMQRKALLDAQARALGGTIASGIAHDINNVLGVVGFGISELEEHVPQCQRENVDRISKAFTMIRDMATRLQKIGKARTEVELNEMSVGEIVSQTIDFAKRHRKIKTCNVIFEEHGSEILKINTYLFEQMIINLMLNAADATDSKGKVEIRVVGTPRQVFIEVHDNGPGISEENRENILRPYFTTKPDGTGLGLSTVKSCAELHGGTLEIGTSHLGGALFRVILPVCVDN